MTSTRRRSCSGQCSYQCGTPHACWLLWTWRQFLQLFCLPPYHTKHGWRSCWHPCLPQHDRMRLSLSLKTVLRCLKSTVLTPGIAATAIIFCKSVLLTMRPCSKTSPYGPKILVFVIFLSIFALTSMPIHAHSRSLHLTPAHSTSLPLTLPHSRSLHLTPTPGHAHAHKRYS